MSICYPREYAVIAMLQKVPVEFAESAENGCPGNDFVARSSGCLTIQVNELLNRDKDVWTIFIKLKRNRK